MDGMLRSADEVPRVPAGVPSAAAAPHARAVPGLAAGAQSARSVPAQSPALAVRAHRRDLFVGAPALPLPAALGSRHAAPAGACRRLGVEHCALTAAARLADRVFL
ncbi:hypothetical protein, partial [Burkholderia pseudomallei]|uniref:hypothetical protein n=1 Tax=Burkholderia pseudomallei TaxID=28450 RepID=UPI0011AF028B